MSNVNLGNLKPLYEQAPRPRRRLIWTNTLVTTQILLLTSRSKGGLRMSALREEETGFAALCYSLHKQRTRSTGGFFGYANTDQGISWLYSLKFAPASIFFSQ